MASKDLVVAGANSAYVALQMDRDTVQDLIKSNIGNRQLDAFSLDVVKTPTGGSTKWIVETLDGDEVKDELEGIIIHWATRRSYWKNPNPDGSPPDCSSPEGLQGYGDPGVACHDCPLNVFGTAVKDTGAAGRGKACSEFRQLFILKPDSLLPFVVNAKPGSLKEVDKYFNRLLGAGLKSTQLVTHLALEKDTNADNIAYAKIKPRAGMRLDPEATKQIEEVAAFYSRIFEGNARVMDHPGSDEA